MAYTKEMLEQLVADGASESQSLEFKRELPRTKDPVDKAEFAKDIAGMANSTGGTILYGLASHHDCASKLMPLSASADPADATMRRLEMTLASAVEPKELRVSFRAIECDGGYVLEAVVPRSYSGPHRVIADGKSHFYFRSNTQVRECTYRELRDAFTGRESAAIAFRAWRATRVELVRGGNGSRSLPEVYPLAVIHSAPLEAFERHVSIDPTPLKGNLGSFVPGELGGLTSNFNLDGIVAYVPNHGGPTSRYVQAFRTGQLEYAFVAGALKSGAKIFSGVSIAEQLRNCIQKHLQLYVEFGFDGPAVFALSVLGVGDYELNADAFGLARSDRNDLILPEAAVESVQEGLSEVDAVARPLLDTLWQCFDADRCHLFDANGKYRR